MPATAGAAQVSSEGHGFVSEIAYEAAAGELNDLSIAAGERGRRVFLADAGAAIDPGKGCSGGGAVGAVVSCTVRALDPPHPALPKFVPILVVVRVSLGGGDDRFDSTELPVRLTMGTRERSEVLLDLRGGDGSDSIAAGPGHDQITPGPGDDVVLAGGGPDVFEAGRLADGSDRLDGEDGDDSILYVKREMPLSLSFDGLPNDGQAGEGDNLLSIRDLLAGQAADLVVGDEGPNTLFGDGGDDELIGSGGEDVLFGDLRGSGADKLWGGAGRDVLFGGHGRDALLAGAGSDELDAATAFAGLGRDGDRDRVECGSGRERGVAEPKDRLQGCEDVHRVRPGRSETTRVPSIFRAPADGGLDRLSHAPRDRRIGVFLARAGR